MRRKETKTKKEKRKSEKQNIVVHFILDLILFNFLCK